MNQRNGLKLKKLLCTKMWLDQAMLMVSYDTFSGGLFIGSSSSTTTKVGRGNK